MVCCCCCCCCCPLRWTGKGLPKATAELAIVGCDMMVKDDVVFVDLFGTKRSRLTKKMGELRRTSRGESLLDCYVGME